MQGSGSDNDDGDFVPNPPAEEISDSDADSASDAEGAPAAPAARPAGGAAPAADESEEGSDSGSEGEEQEGGLAAFYGKNFEEVSLSLRRALTHAPSPACLALSRIQKPAAPLLVQTSLSRTASSADPRHCSREQFI